MIKHTLAALCLSSIATSTAFAAVSAEEAARLGKDLTPMGAEMTTSLASRRFRMRTSYLIDA